MGSTSNIELENIGNYYNLNIIGVLQKDRLRDYPYVNNGFYIINNESSNVGSGTHWTCLYLNKNQSFFYDSFGATPSIDIVKYVKKYSRSFKHNNAIIQDLHSDNCGYYCVGFCLFMTRNKYNYMAFIECFDEDEPPRNDLILEGIMRVYLPSKRPPKELNRFFNLIYK